MTFSSVMSSFLSKVSDTLILTLITCSQSFCQLIFILPRQEEEFGPVCQTMCTSIQPIPGCTTQDEGYHQLIISQWIKRQKIFALLQVQ